MASRRLKLTFPAERIKDPVIGTLAHRFGLMPNIRRARIAEDAAECVLELEGPEDNLEKALDYLREIGIVTEPVDGDYVAP